MKGNIPEFWKDNFIIKGVYQVIHLIDEKRNLYTIHGILQARILEWVVFPSSRGFSRSRNHIQVSCIAGGFFTI